MKKKILNIVSILFLIIALGCGGYLGYYYYASQKSETAVVDLKGEIAKDTGENTDKTDNADDDLPEMVSIDGTMVQKKFESLYRKNHDFMGWLTISDTNVDYPVMFSPHDSENGEYYIHRDFEGKYSAAGLPFIDKNCVVDNPTDNIILYGHNMNSGTMFHDILMYEDKDFYENHKTFTFDTIYGDATYEVVAMFYSQILEESDKSFKYYQFVNAGDEKEFIDYVNNIKNMSIIDTGVKVSYGDKLVTLSTCAYHVKDGRFAVIARKK